MLSDQLNADNGNLNRPNKTITDWLNWWGAEGVAGFGFLDILDDIVGN